MIGGDWLFYNLINTIYVEIAIDEKTCQYSLLSRCKKIKITGKLCYKN